VKCFCNAKNAISCIQDIEIINAFHDGVNDIENVEDITMKKPKTVADLLAVTDVCIEASKAQARLLETQVKGTSRKKEDCEVNTADRGDRKDRGEMLTFEVASFNIGYNCILGRPFLLKFMVVIHTAYHHHQDAGTKRHYHP
jgi:hypothetical protein